MTWKGALEANYAVEELDGVAPTGTGLVIFALHEREGWTVEELAQRAQRARVTHVAVIQLLQRLEKAGLIRRKTCPKDGRVMRVWLTKRGRDLDAFPAMKTNRIHTSILAALSLLALCPAALTQEQSAQPGVNDHKVTGTVEEFAGKLEKGQPAFRRTRVIGYSQVGQPRGGWFVGDGIFESLVGDDRWELLWHGGAGVDRWRDPGYAGWSQPLVSPCPGDAPVDRVLLSVSGSYGSDEKAWAEAIEATLATIKKKIPTARQIILQAVVGGPEGKPCPAPAGGRKARPGGKAGGEVRASAQHPHIVNAVRAVVKKHAGSAVEIVADFESQVRGCDDYADALGHLTPGAAATIARAIGEHYARAERKPLPNKP